MNKLTLPILVCMLAFLTSCAHVYHIRVDAINDGRENVKQTYVIVPGNAKTEPQELQFREYARYLGRALDKKGFMAVGENQHPDIEIYLSYGMGRPHPRVRTYTVPIWGQKGTEITTSESTYETNTGTNTTTTTNITPEYGVTGYTTQEQVQTVYPKYVEIIAYSIKNAQPGDKLKQLWKTSIRGEGKRKDLRRVFPVLIAAAAKYLGGNTGQEIIVPLTRNQPTFKMIMGTE